MKGRIPESFIDDLLARLDIVEVVNRRVPLKKGGKNYMACCPFHDEKTPSFSVSPDKQFYYCFGCGAWSVHGGAVDGGDEWFGAVLNTPEIRMKLSFRNGLDQII